MDFRDTMQKVYSWACQLFADWQSRSLDNLAFDSFCCRLVVLCLAYSLCNRELSYIQWNTKRYKALDIDKLRYLAIVIESEEAYHIPAVIQLLQWLVDIGVKHVCLYDAEGILKKSKESILGKLNNATLFEEAGESNLLLDHKHITLEFASFPDGKEAVAKAANLLFMKYVKLGGSGKIQEEKIFTEAHMSEALRAVGCKGPEPDLLFVYGPVRCHLGFPAWRIRYTEIVHMGRLKSMRYGSLLKAIYKFTMVRQNYGK